MPEVPEGASRALAAEEAAWARRHLEEDFVGWLTTVAPDGRVQTSAISFLWDGESILFYSKPDTPKLRNIAVHPQVSFNLNSDPYADHILVIEGIAETAREFSVPIRISPTRIRAW
jgi:PPOX class probable F420-dependent enzyme